MMRTQDRPLKNRIMRPLILTIAIGFFVIGVAAAVGVLLNARQNVQQLQDVSLLDVSERLSGQLEQAFADVRQVADSTAAQEFAAETIALSGSRTDLQEKQNVLLPQMTALLTDGTQQRLSVRYVMNTGSIWTEITQIDGSIQQALDFNLQRFGSDPVLTAGLRAQGGQVILSQIEVLTEDPGGTPQPIIKVAAPVVRPSDQSVLGVMVLEMDASTLLNSVNQAPILRDGRRLLLVNNQNRVLADSAAPDLTYLLQLQQDEPQDDPLLAYLDQQPGTLNAAMDGSSVLSSQTITTGNAPDMPWRLVVIDDTLAVFGGAVTTSLLVLIVSVITSLGVMIMANTWLDRSLRPVAEVDRAIQRLATDSHPKAERATTQPRPPQRRVRQTVETIQSMQKISDRIDNLTQEIETQSRRYDRNLQIAARLGRETALLRDIDTLLNRAIDLICNTFGFYHAQVFLVDEGGIDAVLIYSRGEAGRKLLEEQHKLAIGSDSVIGRVTATGLPVIVNDTEAQSGAPHAFNPILSATRAEMALPLQIGERIIGALDIQSIEPDVFHQEDLKTYQLLADQIAVAVYKTQLIRDTQERMEQIESLNRQLTKTAWQEIEQDQQLEDVFHYDLLEVTTGDQEVDLDVYETGTLLAAPVVIRGTPIGTITARPPEGESFSNADQIVLNSLAERVALAVENARLFQATQSNLAETETLYQSGRLLNEADQLEDIIHAMIVSAMPEAIAGEIGIFDDYPSNRGPEWLEMVAVWPDEYVETPEAQASLRGLRLRVADHPYLQTLSSTQVAVITDTAQDPRLDSQLRTIFNQLGAQAAVIIPLTVRGVWRGVALIAFPEPREFSEREGRIFSNLIDQAGIAIDNRLLLQQTEEALLQNERLYAASRIINQAQNVEDLVRAAVSTTDDRDLNFGLAIFEGPLDATGWPTQIHHVAQSNKGDLYDRDDIFTFEVSPNSEMRNREPEIVLDKSPEQPAPNAIVVIMRTVEDRFGAIFPLFSVNQPIALFIVSREQFRDLSEEDYEIYRALTGMMSTVLQNRRLLEQTAAALDETRRLYAASRTLNDAQDIEEIYRATAVHLAMGTPQLSRIGVLLAGPDPSPRSIYLEYVYHWARNDQDDGGVRVGLRLNREYLPLAELVSGFEEAVYVQNVGEELTDYPALLSMFEGRESHSVLLSALESRQNWLGMLVCESDVPAAFDEQYRRYVQAVADQLAIALENQLLFEQAQQEAKQALALAEAGQIANQVGGDLSEGINALFQRIAETAGYDRWLLMGVSSSDDALEMITEHSPNPSESLAPSTLSLETSEHPIAEVVRMRRALMINNPYTYPAFESDPEAAQTIGKHIVLPVTIGDRVTAALLVGRDLENPDLTERDEQLAETLAAQVAVTLDNQRLFNTAESEQFRLRSILNTLPAGVLVLDAKTLKPLQFNAQLQELLGQKIDMNAVFSARSYNLYRTGTNLRYPNDELPIVTSLRDETSAFSDDISVIREGGGQTDLLVNAAPIRDARGEVTAIVTAFEDISNLRSLENTLQDNLRETISLYEATRSLAEADELDDVLDVVLFQLIMTEPHNAHVILLDEERGGTQIARSMDAPIDIDQLPGSILHADRSLLLGDAAREMSPEAAEQLAAQGIVAVGSVPLNARGREVPLGWILVTYAEPHVFSPEQERFLDALGDNAAVAIDNRYLFQSTQVALRETMSLYGATTAISRARTLSDLAGVLRSALESLSPDLYAGYIMTDPSAPDHLTELFNVGRERPAVDFESLLVKYGLFREEAIFIEDLPAMTSPNPFEQALLNIGNIGAFASVSLRVKGMPDGRLFVGFHHAHRFAEGDGRYLNAIADSASVVVDNIILLEQIQSALEETSTLYQASRSLADATAAEDILDVVVDKLVAPYVDQAFIALLSSGQWDAPSAMIQIVSSWQREGGIDLHGITLSAEQFPAWRQLASNLVMTIDDVDRDDRLDDQERAGIISLDAQSLAVIPLRVSSRAIGAVWISSREPHRHSEREQRVYQAFAEQASLSLEASFLLDQTERRARQLATSAEVSQIASSILELDALLPRVVDLIQEAFGYDHVQIFLMDEDQRYAELRASTGEAGQQLLAINHKLEKGSASVIGQVAEKAEPVIALDTSDARVVHRPNPYLPLTRSEMALPVVIKGDVIGALDVQSNQPNAFGDDDVSVLRTLAAQIAVAIDNARLFNQAESRADEMSFLFTITTAAASATLLDEALQNVSELMRGSLEALSVGIYLAEENPLPNEQMVQIVALAGSGQPLSEVEQIRVGSEETLIGMVAQDLIPMIVNNVEEEPRYLPLVSSARSAMIVPLNTGAGDLVGLIVMESGRAGAYAQDTLTLLLALGSTLVAIVENKRLLDRVQHQNEELRALDKLKSDFLANMSHELRTPLNSIIGFSRVMLKGIDGELTEMQEQDLTTIYNSGQHLLGLINDILDQAKIAADKMDLQRDYFEIKPMIEGVRSIGIGLVKEKPVDIIVEMAPSMPDAFGDEFRTRQVLLNLISNAAKFTTQGEIAIRGYKVQTDEGHTMIRVDVSDTGIGIAEKDLPLLFEAFQQIDSSLTRTVGGTGLGLPIAKSLVELQGGEMTVHSEVGVGSTFSITIPTFDLFEGEDDNAPEETVMNVLDTKSIHDTHPTGLRLKDDDTDETVEAPAVQVPTNGKRQKHAFGGPPPGVFQQRRQILLIEDNPDMVDQFRRVLQREGYEVFTASIPLEAEAMASGLRPTMIIMDVDFADGQGWNILEKVKDRDDTFDIPVIVATLNSDSEQIYQMGAHQYLQRPFMPDELVKAAAAAEHESNVDRILIIDDQPESTRLMEEALRESGQYRVFAAHTGSEGISMVARRRPDLIILDLRMPTMDGFAVLNELRSQPETAQIPVLVVTSDPNLSEAEREQLQNLEVMYKADLDESSYAQFVNEVRDQIARFNGEA